jgi:outer membrane protein assembly factor BamB
MSTRIETFLGSFGSALKDRWRNRRGVVRRQRQRQLLLETLEDRRVLSGVELISMAHPDLLSATAGGSSTVGRGAVSADGRYVAFVSNAPNLVSGLENVSGVHNVYRFDQQTGEVVLVSVNTAGTGSGNNPSESPVISADGSVVAFRSDASNLHALDTDTLGDIFARNLTTATTHLVSLNKDGTGSGNNPSDSPVISADGAVVAFRSYASNLHALDTNTIADIFARNLTTATTHLVSLNKDGTGSGNNSSHSPVISADGAVVAFRSDASNLHALDTNTFADIFARNLTTATTHLVSLNKDGTGSGNGGSGSPVISADGAVVAFNSYARNLHALDTNTIADIFARNLTTATTHLVSLNKDGTGSGNNPSGDPVISADGAVVAFRSYASNLHALDTNTTWDIFARNLTTGTTHLVSLNKDGSGSGNNSSGIPVISADGAVVAFNSYASNLHALDTNTIGDIFARNLTTGTTHLVSLNKDGTGSGNSSSDSPVISADGAVVAFRSYASNLVDADWNGYDDVVIHAIAGGTATPASRTASTLQSMTAAGSSTVGRGAVSADGRYVAFVSTAPNLVSGLEIVSGANNVYRFDRQTGEVALASLNKDGTGSGNGGSDSPVISADGAVVAFRSFASNLHALDTNTIGDIFARNLTTATTHLVSLNKDGTGSGNDSSDSPVISADGAVVAFRSSASNLHALDTDAIGDIFARNLTTATTHLVSLNKDGTAAEITCPKVR